MQYLKFRITLIRVTVLFLAAAISACEEHNLSPDAGDYFPMEVNKEWHYQRWIIDWESHLPKSVIDTLKLQVGNDVVVEGKHYKEIVDKSGYWNKIVRVEGSKCYARSRELYRSDFSHEYVFLDIDKAVGESWYDVKDSAGYSKAEYVILEKGVAANIQGVVYNDVIKVQVNYYHMVAGGDGDELWLSSVHYYAKGIGEIYNFYPYPVSNMYADLGGFMVTGQK